MKLFGTLAAVSARIPRGVFALALVPLLWAGTGSAQTAKTTKYKYDALGRLTFVEDGQNGNRDYDYDRLGNRQLVATGTASDSAAEPSLATPANRSKNYVANCSWRASWTLVPNATRYDLKNIQNQTTTIYPSTGTNPTVEISGNTLTVYLNCPYNTPDATEPASLKACNADGCSPSGNF
jgi:YD repeat-containing protein